MSVVNTEKWLLDSWNNPIKICENLKKHFKGVSASEIYRHMVRHGMYHRPLKNGNDLIKTLMKNNFWNVVRNEEQILKKLWNGPDIPIYIFPSEPNNRELRQNFNGKSGLAFADKLFLFVSENNSENEIKALFTHEYNHVCRLTKFKKKEKDYVLLDTIILEGLAENAVLEQLGDANMAKWTLYYSDEQLERMWHRIVRPSSHLPKYSRRHRDILYGLRFFPKMVGYCVGYYLVRKCVEENKLTSEKLLDMPSRKIAQVQEDESKLQ